MAARVLGGGYNTSKSLSTENSINFLMFMFYFPGDDDDEEEEDEDEEGVHCSGCGNDVDDCSCQKILDNFHTLNRQL